MLEKAPVKRYTIFQKLRIAAALVGVAATCGIVEPVLANDPASCSPVRIAETGWSDNAAVNGVTAVILEGLSYKTEIPLLSRAMTYVAMRTRKIDVFLGDWNPAGTEAIKPFLANGSVKQIAVNLSGGHFTLAVPEYTWQEGLQSFSDLQKWAGRLDNKIYGLESGNGGNELILNAIKKNEFDLSSFKLVESSEEAMLGTVDRMIQKHLPVVFLGWEPHPMNQRFKIKYLSGGDSVFGPDMGSSVHTVVRKDYENECPNVAGFLKRMRFSIDMENTLMSEIKEKHETPKDAARAWLVAHPAEWQPWLDQVTDRDGNPAVSTLQKYLGLTPRN